MFNLKQFSDKNKFLAWAKAQNGDVFLQDRDACALAQWAAECGAERPDVLYTHLYTHLYTGEFEDNKMLKVMLPPWAVEFSELIKENKFAEPATWGEIADTVEGCG